MNDMRILYITAALVALLAPSAWAVSVIHIRITTNAEPATYTINDRPVSRQELSTNLTLVSKVAQNQTIILEPAPLTPTRIFMDIVSELKALGLTNARVYYRESSVPLASPKFTLSIPLNLDAAQFEKEPELDPTQYKQLPILK